MRRLHALLLACSILSVSALACGGKVTFVDDGSGSGGSGTTSTSKAATGTSSKATTGTGVSCDALKSALDAANAEAQACNPTVSSPQCDGSEILVDPCGCASILANEKQPAKIAAAKSANEAWLAQGCGPVLCGGGCFPAGPGFCNPTPDGSGTCVSAVFLD